MSVKSLKRLAFSCFFASLAGACAGDSVVPLDGGAHSQSVLETVERLHGDDSVIEIELSLHDAIQRAMSKNLDVKVAELEALIATDNVNLAYLEALPSVKAGANFTHRDDDAASSSRSVLTGTQSLEPSTSADQSRRLADLEASWNVTDAVVAYINGRSAGDKEKITVERLRKIRHTIERDVTEAYWRAHEAQRKLASIKSVGDSAENILQRLKDADDQKLFNNSEMSSLHAQISSRYDRILSLKDEAQSAEIELKTLVNIPLNYTVNFLYDLSDLDSKNDFKNIDKMIGVALKSRPEMREQYLNKNIAARQMTQEILGTFPGLNLIYTLNYDSNSFLSSPNWQNASAALGQSLNAFLSLSSRIDIAKTNYELEEKRRLALAAAIVAQIHINKIKILIAEERVALAEEKWRRADKNKMLVDRQYALGSQSRYRKVLSDMDAIEAESSKDKAFMDLYKARADMRYTLGISSYDVVEVPS